MYSVLEQLVLLQYWYLPASSTSSRVAATTLATRIAIQLLGVALD
jgi:hypothetical protein